MVKLLECVIPSWYWWSLTLAYLGILASVKKVTRIINIYIYIHSVLWRWRIWIVGKIIERFWMQEHSQKQDCLPKVGIGSGLDVLIRVQVRFVTYSAQNWGPGCEATRPHSIYQDIRPTYVCGYVGPIWVKSCPMPGILLTRPSRKAETTY